MQMMVLFLYLQRAVHLCALFDFQVSTSLFSLETQYATPHHRSGADGTPKCVCVCVCDVYGGRVPSLGAGNVFLCEFDIADLASGLKTIGNVCAVGGASSRLSFLVWGRGGVTQHIIAPRSPQRT